MAAPEELLERIRLRLDESFTGIGEVVTDLPAADVADLINQLTLAEAATVIMMLPVPRAVRLGNENYPLFADSRKLDSLRGDPRFRGLMEDLKRRFDERTARR